MSDWKPIVTAPRDGSRILVFMPQARVEGGDGTAKIMVGWWENSERRSHGKVIYSHQGWGVDRNGFGLHQEPTHWMPLPEPPDGTESSS